MSFELIEARAASNGLFDPEILANNLYKHDIPRRRINEIVKILEKEPILQDRYMYRELSREDQFRYSFRVTTKILELSKKHSWTLQELNGTMTNIFGDKFPTSLHNSAFKYVIKVIGSDEQGKEWLPKCDTHEVIGCYAQTELGHGSNVRALQTKAFYDPKLKHVVLCSSEPLTARKWWIGGLGVTADHAAVQASLYFPPKDDPQSTDRSKYKYLGPHMFIVPIRNPTTREPLPGVTVGDIGPKAANGFSIIDNGFLALDNVRIPASNLLSRFTSIDTTDPKGARYVLTGNPKVMYASMTNLRAGYPFSLGLPLCKAVTIASRYLTIRRQFYDNNDKTKEVQVVKYSSVYSRLVPFVALAHSIGFIYDGVQTSYLKMMDQLVGQGSDALLPEVHVITSSIKGVISMKCTRSIEQCQILMGGHGFSYHSGLSTLYGNALPAQTFEGENYVVAQQTANALAKQYVYILEHGKKAAAKNLFPASQFLIKYIDRMGLDASHGPGATQGISSPKTVEEWLANDEYIIELFEKRTTSLVSDFVMATRSTDPKDRPHLGSAVSFAFGEQFIITQYIRGAANINDPATRDIVLRLARILAYKFLVDDNVALSLLEFSHINAYSIRPLRDALQQEIKQIAPHVIALTDAFGFTDYELNTALGNYNGLPYETLMERAKKSTLNTSFVNEIAALKRAGLTGSKL
ncbi:uncharacterized protein SAPINGB_P003814 [Magnusiomyces paraingens]|uniref:Acyl-coenzyme A oxidase n=1 Tax=Magnusiomyces paraingens TaxID=2606893 RepID=A0A5E8BYQ3_9ASCO|nr:uncharacterized protein SAPINGB_P003814 [Saprochaete ingens]VVT53915.1 unnamed protein product [Saprochaete ingens]